MTTAFVKLTSKTGRGFDVRVEQMSWPVSKVKQTLSALVPENQRDVPVALSTFTIVLF